MRRNTVFLTRTALLLALALVMPLIGLPQPVTGVAVNTILYLATVVVGPLGGIIIGCFTPWVALLRGILPPPLLIAAPCIMLGNIMLVLCFHYLRKKNIILGAFLAALAKFFIFLLLGKFIFNTFLHFSPQLLLKVSTILGLPQLFTSLLAAFLSIVLLSLLPRKYFWKNGRKYY